MLRSLLLAGVLAALGVCSTGCYSYHRHHDYDDRGYDWHEHRHHDYWGGY